MTPVSLRILRTVLVAAAAAVGPAAAGAQQQIRRAFPLAPDGAVRVYVLSGQVRVVGGDGDSVVVSGTVPAGQTLHAGGGIRGVKLGVWEEGAAAVVKPSSLLLHVPRRSRVWVKGGQSADVEVSGVTGGLDLNIVAGTVRVRGAPRELNVEAMDGSVEITGSPAWLRAKTASGGITLRGASEDVALSSVSGSIRVSGGPVTRGRFESVTGDIRFHGVPERGGAVTFDSHSGLVELRLPRDVAAEFEIATILGTIDNALSLARPVAGREARGRELAFAIGGTPAATVTVRNFKGRVALLAR